MPAGQFPQRLRALRQSHRLTQAALAQLLGLAHQGHISNLEAGRKAPSIDVVVRVADLFGVTTDHLLRGSDADPIGNMSPKNQPVAGSLFPRLFGAKLRYLRLQHRVLQSDLATQLGLARQGYVSNLENNRTEPSLDLVVRVADRFGVSTDYLLRDTVAVDDLHPPD